MTPSKAGDVAGLVARLREGQRDLHDVAMDAPNAAFNCALPAYLGEAADALDAAHATIAERDARIAELEAAVRPFARAFHAKVHNPKRSASRRAWGEEMPGDWPIELTVTMQDGRAARAAIEGSQP